MNNSEIQRLIDAIGKELDKSQEILDRDREEPAPVPVPEPEDTDNEE